jgi:cytochrome P450
VTGPVSWHIAFSDMRRATLVVPCSCNLFLQDTSATTAEWLILNAANEEGWQSRLRAEAQATLAAGQHLGDADMPETTAFINESLRYTPTVGMNVPHVATEAVTIMGEVCPAGTIIITNARRCFVNVAAIGEAPEVFNPERFMPPHECPKHVGSKTNFTPFSVGRRGCPGYKLAMTAENVSSPGPKGRTFSLAHECTLPFAS